MGQIWVLVGRGVFPGRSQTFLGHLFAKCVTSLLTMFANYSYYVAQASRDMSRARRIAMSVQHSGTTAKLQIQDVFKNCSSATFTEPILYLELRYFTTLCPTCYMLARAVVDHILNDFKEPLLYGLGYLQRNCGLNFSP